ncbi:PEP-CTERM sorting domain-containing protein [Roseateles sp. P5_E7]
MFTFARNDVDRGFPARNDAQEKQSPPTVGRDITADPLVGITPPTNRLPEPASLALTLGALAMTTGSRRRH